MWGLGPLVLAWGSASRRFRETMRAVLAIAMIVPLVAGCAISSNREDPVETPPPPAWRDIGTVPVPTDIRQVIEQKMILHDPQRIPSNYRLYGDFTNYAFTVSTADPATATLDFLTRDSESGGLSWQWELTTTIPPEPRADLGPHAPSGFAAPLPGIAISLLSQPEIKASSPWTTSGHALITRIRRSRLLVERQIAVS